MPFFDEKAKVHEATHNKSINFYGITTPQYGKLPHTKLNSTRVYLNPEVANQDLPIESPLDVSVG